MENKNTGNTPAIRRYYKSILKNMPYKESIHGQFLYKEKYYLINGCSFIELCEDTGVDTIGSDIIDFVKNYVDDTAIYHVFDHDLTINFDRKEIKKHMKKASGPNSHYRFINIKNTYLCPNLLFSLLDIIGFDDVQVKIDNKKHDPVFLTGKNGRAMILPVRIKDEEIDKFVRAYTVK